MLSLESLTPAATVRIPLVHPFARGPEDAPVPLDGAALVLHGPYTAAAREHFLAVADRATDAKPTLTAALADQRATVRALCVAVEGLTLDGVALTPADLTDDRHEAIPLLLEQVFRDYAAVQDFFDAPKATSSPSPDTTAVLVSA